MVSADSPPREQFYRNEISKLLFTTPFFFFFFSYRLRSVFLGIILESFLFLYSLYGKILEFFLQRIASTKKEFSTRNTCISPRDIILSSKWSYLKNILVKYKKKKMSLLLHSRALKILTPTREERSTWGGKKISESFHPSVRKSAPRFVFYFKIRARGEQGGGKEMVPGPVHPFLNPSVWWQMVSRLVTWHFELDLIMRRIIEQPRNRVCRPSNVNLWHLSDISCKGCRPKSLFRGLDTRIDRHA